MAHTEGPHIHLVGSVPLPDAAAVFETAGSILGEHIRRLPDGETGPRKNWINFQYAMLARHPAFEFAGPPIDPDTVVFEGGGKGADYVMPTPLRLRAGIKPEDVRFDSLGYFDNARASYAAFAELKSRGKIHGTCRFMVALPTPLAPIAPFVVPEQIDQVLPAYARGLMGELAKICETIPHGELAVQWDIAIEFGLWEGVFPPPPGDWKSMLLGQMAQLGDAVPAGVELGYHLCYGDRGHKHFKEPTDTANLVEVANGISARVKRSIEWIHMPVPRDRSDDAYFAPLKTLKLKPGTELVLGLVHHTDGVDGTRRRMAAARKVVKDFGIATECGLGRRDPNTIPELLRIHADAAG
jgi:hypothetical protein